MINKLSQLNSSKKLARVGLSGFVCLAVIGCVKITDKKEESVFSQNYQDKVIVEGKLEASPQDPDQPLKIFARRLELKTGAQIITHGAPLEIEVEELESHQASIETFSQEEQTTNSTIGVDGADSGAVIIRVRKAISGDLKIISRGQAGGKGYPGRSAEDLGLGVPEKAAKGADAIGFCESTRDPLSRLDRLRLLRAMICSCDMDGQAGSPGAKGFPGEVGGAGYRGGNAGAIQLEIPEDSAPKVEFYSLGGAAGLGGDGGLGGAGGPGGDGGAGWRNRCKAGSQGAPGPQGDAGPRGNSGLPGEKAPACLHRGSQIICVDQLP